MKRIFALFISIVAVALCFTAVIAAEPVSSEEDVVRIIACSDFQQMVESGPYGSDREQVVRNILSAMARDGVRRADGFLCCGDYDQDGEDSVDGIRRLQDVMSDVIAGESVLVQGNHDDVLPGTNGLSPSGANDPASGAYGVYVIHEDDYPASVQDYGTVRAAADRLTEYLTDKVESGFDRPIFVLSHIPLHYSMRTYYNGDCMYASFLVDAMNEAADRGLNIVYLFGHNHSYFYDNYLGQGSIYLTPGDSINVATDWNKYQPKELGFHYMNPGYVGYCYPYEPGADSTLTMTLFEIRDGELTVKRYDEDGLHRLKSSGVDTGIYPGLGFAVDDRVYTSPQVISLSTPTPTEYTVTFMADGREVARHTTTKKNGAVTPSSPPAKNATAQYTYTFDSWVYASGEAADLKSITEDITVYASYKSTVNRYTVTYMNGDVELYKTTVNYGSAADMPAPPTKEATVEHTYEFAGWVDADDNVVDISNVTGDVTVYASFKEVARQYTVTFMNGEERYASFKFDYGKAGKAPEKAPEFNGEADPDMIYTFDKWLDAEGNEADLSVITGDITVYASYVKTNKDVTVTFMNGEAEFEKVTVNYGAAAAATATPEKATENFTKYTFDKWVDAEGNAVDLSAVTADVTVYASYTTECEHNFSDLKAGEWYETAVEWALMNGVMNGEGAKFNPNNATTRAMLVTVLYRLEGSPDVSGVEHPFTDLKAGDWYYNAVLWAYDNGVVNGMTATTFAPTGTLTREQFATILYRYAKELKGEDMTVAEDANLDKYTDKDTVSSYAADAVLWANVKGYIGGMTANTIAPKGNATRAQMATILYRSIKK